MKVSLDWNCVIEVEEERSQASFVKALIEAHRSNKIDVALLAASASENTKEKCFPGTANKFKERVAKLGWKDLPLVPMPALIDLTFIGNSHTVGDKDAFNELVDKLWSVIAPKTPRKLQDVIQSKADLCEKAIHSPALYKWRNAWCDVMSAYCHIYAERDVFVTNNTKDFQRNAVSLVALGMTKILTPAETLQLVD